MIGELAPDFRALAVVADRPLPLEIRRDDFRGKWLTLVFYPRDFSFVCPTELTALSVRIDAFRDLGAEILGVSVDDVETHARWLATPRKEGGVAGLKFPLAADPDGSIARAYGVFLKNDGVAARGLFLIDPEGVVQYGVVHNQNVGRKSEEILRVLEALQTGGLCAEGWTAADSTIDLLDALGPGRVFSHFRIERPLGKGGFACVFQASDLRLHRTVALKILRNLDATKREALLQEARLAASLNHANICTIYAVDESEGLPVIVMEFVDGPTLAQALKEGPPPTFDADRTIREIASSLAAARCEGIVHGDLKPANVMFDGAGRTKILDFGLARRADAVHERAEGDRPTRAEAVADALTIDTSENGARIVGTPFYMAPERTWGEPPTPASDVFSLGLVAYEALRRRRLFRSAKLTALLREIRSFDVQEIVADVEPRYRSFLRGCLEPAPGARFTIFDALDALDATDESGAPDDDVDADRVR